jgi:hypothetical protein
VLIIAGHKQVRKVAGFAADFCPICRDFRAFEVAAVRKVPHVYYIPVSAGGVVVHELECLRCRTLLGIHDPGHTGHSRGWIADLAELARLTNPDVMARNRGRLDQLDRLHRGELADRERRDMIREPFEALDYMIQRRHAKGAVPVLAIVAIAAAVLFIGSAVGSVAGGNGGNGGPIAATVFTILAAATGAFALWSLRTGPRRWARKHIHPRLAAALIPLSPTERELSAALEQMRQAKRIIARRIRSSDLYADLERIRAGGRT